LAPLPLQPEQPRPVVRVFGSLHRSAHAPAVVLQPTAASQAAAQHWLVGPTVQAVTVSVHEQGGQVPAPSQTLLQEPGKSWNAPDAQESAAQAVVPHEVPAGRKVSAHEDVPLHERVAQSVDGQLIGVPAQPDAPHESPHVQGLPSSQESLVRHCQTPPTRVHQ
jgi:hypothetical protein